MTGTDTGAALLKAMAGRRDIRLSRLAYADWLEEQGRDREAEVVRWVLAKRKRPYRRHLHPGSPTTAGVHWSWWECVFPGDCSDLPPWIFRHLTGGERGEGRRCYPTRLEAELDLYAAYVRWKEEESAQPRGL